MGKVCTLDEAAALVPDGALVGLGGGLTLREPAALVRMLVRAGRRDLHLVGGAHGYAVDLPCAAGCVRLVQHSYVGFEHDLGLAPHFRRLTQTRQIHVLEDDELVLYYKLQAAALGLTYLPLRRLDGSDTTRQHDYRQETCPYTGVPLTCVPALTPDVALIHANAADESGNLHIAVPVLLDAILAAASRTVIATCERLVSHRQLAALGATVPALEVACVVEAPWGAHPTACYPDYAYDREHLLDYLEGTSDREGAGLRQYLDHWVHGSATPKAYSAALDPKRCAVLRGWRRSKIDWRKVFEHAEN